MRKINKDELNIRILQLLREEVAGKKTVILSRILHVSYKVIYGRLTRLRNASLISKEGEFWKLTGAGQSWLLEVLSTPRPVSETLNSSPSPPQPTQTLRIHSISLAFPILEAQDAPTQVLALAELPSRLAGLLNQDSRRFIFNTYQAMLTQGNLIIYGHQPEEAPLAFPPYEAFLDAVNALFSEAKALEARLHIKLKRLERGTLTAKIMLNHNALTGSQLAEYLIRQGTKLPVDIDGVIRIIIDHSHSFEFEAVAAEFAIEDINNEIRFHRQILTGNISPEKLASVERMAIATAEGMKYANQFFTSHNALIDELRAEIRDLRAERQEAQKPGLLRRLWQKLW